MPANPGLSREVQIAMQRRQQGTPSPALGQVSPQAANAPQMPAPMPQGEMTGESAPPTSKPVQAPKFEAQDRKDLIVLSLIEQLKNDNKLDKEKSQIAPPAAPAQPAPNAMGMGGGSFSMSPGFEQPMPVSAMQSNYQNGMGKDYSGLNNYGKGF